MVLTVLTRVTMTFVLKACWVKVFVSTLSAIGDNFNPPGAFRTENTFPGDEQERTGSQGDNQNILFHSIPKVRQEELGNVYVCVVGGGGIP